MSVQVSPHTTAPARLRSGVRRLLLLAAAVLLLVAAWVGYAMHREAAQYVSTDNAQLYGQPVQVGSMNAGRVASLNVTIGSSVHRDDVLASVELPSQTGTAQNGQPRLGFLGNADTRADVTSPIDGVVIATPVAVGASVAPGQAIVSILDPRQLWVNANIEETDVQRVKVGQRVEVHVDVLNADVPGRVVAITPASAATFSLLPTGTSSGNFTKVVQLVPVRISVNLSDRPALHGTSAEVRIRVKE